MPEVIQVGDLVRYSNGRSLYLVLKLPRSGWFSSPFVTVREYQPGKLFANKEARHEFMLQNLKKDVFQTLLMQAELRNWFSGERKNAEPRVGSE